jgi:hypothetical protein
MPKLLSPTAKQQFFTDGSTVAAGYLLYTYAAGTTTPEATYSNRAGTVANANPITLNSRGEAIIYLSPGVIYDYVLKTTTGTTVWTREDVSADAGDAAAVYFTASGSGSVARDVQSKLGDVAQSPQDKGAVANGASDDTVAINTAIAGNRSVRLVGDYLVTSVTNPLGVEFEGEGRIFKAITGGNQQINSKADDGQHFFGQEYLYALHTKLFSGSLTAKFVCSGDSTVAGDGTTAPWGFVSALASAAYHKGHLITFTNSGHSGEDTSEWVSTYLPADMIAVPDPDCYLVRWGINDPFNGRTIEQFATSLRAGLATIRAARTVAQTSIILMVPNSTSDTPNGRDEQWYEKVRKVCRQAARDYQCCYIDTYALWKDSRGAAGLWMDDPFADGRAIHPSNLMNMQIVSRISDYIFPELMRPRLANGTNLSKTASSLPSTYPFGWSHYSTASGDTTFPMKNAHIVTFKSLNGICYQIAQSGWASEVTGGTVNNGNLAKGQFAIRMGQHSGATDTWFAWTSHAPLDLTSLLVNGWVSFAAGNNPSASMNNNVVTLSGLIKSGTTANGTTLFTLPAGWRPRNTVEAFQVSTNTGAATTTATIYVNSTGVVNVQVGANANALSLSGISFEAGN